MLGTISSQDAITLQVPSASIPGSYHTLRLFDDGTMVCSCKGFTYRRSCRHITDEYGRACAWDRRVCRACGAAGPSAAFNATTEYTGGRGYLTTHICRDTGACAARQGVAVA